MSVRLAALVALLVAGSAGAGSDVPALTFLRRDLAPREAKLTEGFGMGDLDGDGRVDLIEGGDEALVWYRNPGWELEPIATGYRYAAGSKIVAVDLDGDGRRDVVVGRYPVGVDAEREMVWFANRGSRWVEHRLSATAFCHDLVFGDVDGDGRADGVCDDQFRRLIVVLHGPADPTDAWPETILDARPPMGATLADVDRDGRLDVLDGRAWYRNDGPGGWRRFPFTTLADERHPFFDDYARLSAIDLDRDGRLDVVATLFTDTPHGRVMAFLQPEDPTGTWAGVVVDPGPLFVVHSQSVGRFDGSDRPQVVVGEANLGGHGFGLNPAPRVLVYRLLGDPRDPAAWERTVVDGIGTLEAEAVDLDGDGLPEIVGHERLPDDLASGIGRVSIWQNRTAVPGVEPPPGTPCAAPCASECRLEAMTACSGERLPPVAERARSRACRLTGTEPGGRRRAGAARRVIRRASNRLDTLVRRGALTPGCGLAVRGLFGRILPAARGGGA